MNDKRKLGDWGEKIASRYLQNKNYIVLATNFQNSSGRRLGEIDIIAKDIEENTLVFAEVKTREYHNFQNTLPEENITYFKLKKLNKIAEHYIKLKKTETENYRFDAISVWWDAKNKKAYVKHIIGL